MDPGPVELEAMMATLSLSTDNRVNNSVWKYYADKYNAERENGPVYEFHQEKKPVKCPVLQYLVKYLANREKDRERSQSNPQCMRNNLVWCHRKERINQEAIHNVLRDRTFEGEGEGMGFPKKPVRP
jgi:hypothetical protein